MTSPNDPFWTEGLVLVGNAGWQSWSKTRVYRSVPAGSHISALQCATNQGTLQVSEMGTYSSWSVVELKL